MSQQWIFILEVLSISQVLASSQHLLGTVQSKHRGLTSVCHTKTDFVETCEEQLISDQDLDPVVSQEDYASLLCGGSGCSFADLPWTLQLTFVKSVCDHVDDNDDDQNDCLENIMKNDFSHEKFGLNLKKSKAMDKNEVGGLCNKVFPNAIETGYVRDCNGDNGSEPNLLPPQDGHTIITSSSPSLSQDGKLEIGFAFTIETDGIDAASFLSGENPPNTLKDDLIRGIEFTVLQTLEEAGLRRMSMSADLGTGAHRMEPKTTAKLRSQTTRYDGRRLTTTSRSSLRDLASYDPTVPVKIISALDDTCWSQSAEAENNNCVYVKSVVTVFLDEDDHEDAIRLLIISGLRRKGIPLSEFSV